ncbi:chorismate-binding protein [Leucobacter weissii]|uniref:Chorismate-binding protein n=1 Tax=Leucobacter weissii TaxID=1983706 RepID=A0A939MIK4_9MICO|nr:chorismate-binding protein [Leucobacter weissii]MBO1901578.1 chorismate-binding protein [Leucobacter weissii]
MTSGSAAPEHTALRAVTRPLDAPLGMPELLARADPTDPLVWIRGDRGAVGVGETLRLRFSGPGRFSRAAQAWRELSSAAEIDDPVRLPGSGLVAFGAFAFDDESEAASVLVVPRLLIARHRGTAWITEISRDGNPVPPSTAPSARRAGAAPAARLPVAAPDEAYLASVGKARGRIELGEAEKIVVARRVAGTVAADGDLRVPLGRLAERYDGCWTYAVDGILGASPETLVRRADGAISARVLAGTRARRLDDPAADARVRDELLTSSKEQHEHAFAVQSVVTALSPHVDGLRTSEEPFALGLPNVWHLATDLGALPGRESSLELAAALHPTAAVAGTPTSVAVSAIAELESFDRGRYAGPVGWIDADGDGEWVIALRCAELGPPAGGIRTITAYAGGGIVEGSDPAREFAETVSKFAPIVEAFAAAD